MSDQKGSVLPLDILAKIRLVQDMMSWDGEVRDRISLNSYRSYKDYTDNEKIYLQESYEIHELEKVILRSLAEYQLLNGLPNLKGYDYIAEYLVKNTGPGGDRLVLRDVFMAKPVGAEFNRAIEAFLSIPSTIRQQYTPILSKSQTPSVQKLLASIPAAFSGAPGGPSVGGRALKPFGLKPRYYPSQPSLPHPVYRR
jgi:hypothetical protein